MKCREKGKRSLHDTEKNLLVGLGKGGGQRREKGGGRGVLGAGERHGIRVWASRGEQRCMLNVQSQSA